MTEYERKCIEDAMASMNAALAGEVRQVCDQPEKSEQQTTVTNERCGEAPRRRNPFSVRRQSPHSL